MPTSAYVSAVFRCARNFAVHYKQEAIITPVMVKEFLLTRVTAPDITLCFISACCGGGRLMSRFFLENERERERERERELSLIHI